jgi:hypothetical protein
MNVSIEFEGWNDSKSRRMIDTIYDTSLKIFAISDEENIPVNQAANTLAERRIKSIRKISKSYLGNVGIDSQAEKIDILINMKPSKEGFFIIKSSLYCTAFKDYTTT